MFQVGYSENECSERGPIQKVRDMQVNNTHAGLPLLSVRNEKLIAST